MVNLVWIPGRNKMEKKGVTDWIAKEFAKSSLVEMETVCGITNSTMLK